MVKAKSDPKALSSKEDKQKIGILGGTFDPVHSGHLEVAHTVLNRYGLDQIFFIPAYSPPHKERQVTPFAERVAMLEAALEMSDVLSVSILEAERSAPSYTVETLLELHQRIASAEFYLIIGADMFVEIEQWYRYDKLFELSDIIVAARPGISRERVAEQIAVLPGSFSFDPEQQKWYRNDGARIFYCADISMAISSSDIRKQLVAGNSVADAIPSPVMEYIQSHKLYASPGNEY